jgi:hypothetical protein
MRLAAPRLNLRSQETGLESMFNSVFSLSDEPAEMLGHGGGGGGGEGDGGSTGDVVDPGSLGARDVSGKASAEGWVGAGLWTLVVAVLFGLVVAWFMAKESLGRFLVSEALESLPGKDRIRGADTRLL